ncbi:MULTISPECIES: hypothetical protein [unclassified Wenzhouxiangella]|uniref:hypothetical protein n=1 Tax=unclassified Wenzhouxiangella TaxID=2613841 RepID=UPI0015F2A465|nr:MULTISPECIES: hypothetical protein [unclassified Wenzhouxiangella]
MEEIDFNIEVKELLESYGLPVSDVPQNDQIQLFGIKERWGAFRSGWYRTVW